MKEDLFTLPASSAWPKRAQRSTIDYKIMHEISSFGEWDLNRIE